MSKRKPADAATKSKAKAPPDLPAYREALIDRHAVIGGKIQQAQQEHQETIVRLVGDLNQNAGALIAVNRMLGRAENDGAL